MTLLIGVLLASLAGSIHCAAMCGAFVCAYAAPRGPAATAGPAAHAAYHGGRLVSYLTLGALAGFAGSGLNRLGVLAGIGRGAAIVAGALMTLWAAVELARLSGARVPQFRATAATAFLTRLLSAGEQASATRRALTLGLVTTLIPCGWLYAFVATAAATGKVLAGVAVMAVFWLGTVPMLMGVAFGANRIFGRAPGRWPVAAALLVLALGLLTIAGRVQAIPLGTPGVVHVGH